MNSTQIAQVTNRLSEYENYSFQIAAKSPRELWIDRDFVI